MANSVAYILSQNTYPTAGEAYNVGVLQGPRIVYATTSTLSGANVLYAESDLIQPVYGNGSDWYGIQLLTNTGVKYAITIDVDGSIVID